MEKFIITTSNLKKQFGKFTAVDGLNLNVPEGEVFGFLGPNGAGKSTTIRMLLGLIKPTAGEVRVFGKPFDSNRLSILKNVGSLVEYPSYYGNLTAYENLNITRKILELDKSEIDRVLDIVSLTEWKDRLAKKFSLGMKQRLGIANALLGNPKLLILDEPTNGLDPAGIHEIRDLIRSLPKEYGITVLVSSHLLSEIELMAGYVGIINKGRLIFQGPLDKLRNMSKKEIRIDVSPIGKAEAFLKASGYDVNIKDKSIFVQKEGITPSSINRELVMKGFEVSHLSMDTNSLEDIFLDITGEEAV